jgi:hypothetical protein
MQYNSLETKFIRLMLDPAARGGEINNSAEMLIRSLRQRGILAEAFLNGDSNNGPAFFDYGDIVMPLKKHKGQKLRDIPDDYILWVVENVTSKPLLVKQCAEYLRQKFGI